MDGNTPVFATDFVNVEQWAANFRIVTAFHGIPAGGCDLGVRGVQCVEFLGQFSFRHLIRGTLPGQRRAGKHWPAVLEQDDLAKRLVDHHEGSVALRVGHPTGFAFLVRQHRWPTRHGGNLDRRFRGGRFVRWRGALICRFWRRVGLWFRRWCVGRRSRLVCQRRRHAVSRVDFRGGKLNPCFRRRAFDDCASRLAPDDLLVCCRRVQ